MGKLDFSTVTDAVGSLLELVDKASQADESENTITVFFAWSKESGDVKKYSGPCNEALPGPVITNENLDDAIGAGQFFRVTRSAVRSRTLEMLLLHYMVKRDQKKVEQHMTTSLTTKAEDNPVASWTRMQEG